ncbi:MAG TPA: cell division protein ZapA [Caulobacteraceae bacterium]|nr:cell division protein ZapA [Caulobacteraceae bacterium]
MATVTVEVNGRPYNVGCADGQETRVRELARQFDEHVRQIGRDVGQVGDLRLFLMAALLVSDELADIRGQLHRLQADLGAGEPGDAGDGAAAARAAEALNRAAERIEKLAVEIA